MLKNPSVQDIQKEILYNGAVSIDWSQPKHFSHIYHQGIVDNSMQNPLSNDLTHVSILVGWGTDKSSGTDYWILRNSYGAKFGMNSVMYVKRGINALRMEENIVGFDVELLN